MKGITVLLSLLVFTTAVSLSRADDKPGGLTAVPFQDVKIADSFWSPRIKTNRTATIEANLRQFLDLGKPPVGARVSCDLVKLIDQAVSMLKPQCQHAGIALVWEAPDTAARITGDPAQLSHLFGNVIGNAVEAAGPGGIVSVKMFGPCIEVTDTGPGPPSEIAAKLFEPFVTGKEEGIGLGLAVAKQAAEAHGGTLTWERRDGKTVFRIALASP